MGASHVTNYAKALQFVQNLTDDNFGQVDVYRNQQGKFIMKCKKSFITGDKRHSDFIKVLEFIKNTKNPNIIPVLYLEQYQQSNVCISYEKLELYSQYLNFTLQGLIRNKKTIEEPQIWYLIKTILTLIQDLQRENMRMTFSLDNIFLTLKGIPSVFLYHFFIDQKPQSTLQFENNQYQFVKQNNDSSTKDDNFHVEQNQEQQNLIHQQQHQISFKPYCMHYCLAKIILQLFNMKMISTQDNQIQEMKKLLFSTLKQNNKLGKMIKSLLINPKTQQLFNQLKHLQQTHQIRLSTEIRFNKFRYIMTQEQKPNKDLTLNDNNLVDFKSKPITPINTPIYRLREQQNAESSSKQFGIKSKLLMSQQHFFKKKTNEKIIDFKRPIRNNDLRNQLQNFTSQKIQGRTKAYSIGGKQNLNYQQEIKGRKTNLERGSKLSLVGNSRNLSTSKINKNAKIQDSQMSINENYNQLGLALSRQFYSHQLGTQKIDQQSNLANQSSISISNIQSVKQKPSKQLKSTNRIKQILNEQILRSKQQFMSVKKSTLLNTKIHQQQSYKLTFNHPQKIKAFFKSQHLNQQHTKSQKQQPNKKLQQSQNHYKPYVTEIQPQSQDFQNQQQKVKQIHTLSNQKHSQMKQSINALDKSNFLLTLELKKSRNNLKVKQLTQRKDSIMLDLPNKKLSKGNQQTHQNIKQYLKQKIQTKSTQFKQNKPLQQISLNQNVSSDRITENGQQKKKIKLKNDKIDIINNQKSNSNLKLKDQNKQNITYNIDQMMRNSKLRKVSIRAKGQSVK